MDIEAIVPELLMKHPAVINASLTGSRSSGEATRWSDWDFIVETNDFKAISAALPELFESIEPLSYLWDPLSRHQIFMLILKGPVKVDIIFDLPHELEPPLTVSPETIGLINSHFFDWILWIGSKGVRGQTDTVSKELEKMYAHLLKPLGCTRCPSSVEEAVRGYIPAFQQKIQLFDTVVAPELKIEVVKGLKAMGFKL